MADGRPAGRAGQGALRRAGRRRLRHRARRHHRAHRPAAAAAPRGQPRAGAHPRRRRAHRRRRRAVRRHPVRRAPARRPAAARDRREGVLRAGAADRRGRGRRRSWRTTRAARQLLDALRTGESPRAVWTVLPGDDWADLLAEAVVADGWRRARRARLRARPPRPRPARRGADRAARRGPPRRAHRRDRARRSATARSSRSSRGAVRVVIGTRAAAFAPVQDLGLVAIWDDGDDLHDEPRAPYPHAREVLLMRAQETGCAARAGRPRTQRRGGVPPAHRLGHRGGRRRASVVRERISVGLTGDSDRDLPRDAAARSARLPSEALQLLRDAVQHGPVLVQAPRVGYATRLACDRCRTPALCSACHGPLRLRGPSRPPECAWCATAAPGWACPECGGRGLRAPVLGDARTAEEIGRAIPGVTVRQSSSGERVLAEVDDKPAIVVATPGAEPVARGGYAAVLLLDTWLLLGRADLRATEEAMRRWANAAALVRPAADGGRVLAVGRGRAPGPAGADPLGPRAAWPAARSTSAVSAHLPPASRVATVTGEPDDLEAALPTLAAPARRRGARPGAGGGARRPRRGAGALRRPRPARLRARRCRRRCSSCRPSGRPASCRTCGSRSTRPSSADPQSSAYVVEHDAPDRNDCETTPGRSRSSLVARPGTAGDRGPAPPGR